MRVRVDTDKCTGHGRCYAVAPLVFTCDDAGYGEPLIEGDLPPEYEEKARSAAMNCPEDAVIVIE